jgi:hypothetical protein
MKIEMTLVVDEPTDVDTTDSTGLTEQAFERLSDALMACGFSIDQGPTQVVGS